MAQLPEVTIDVPKGGKGEPAASVTLRIYTKMGDAYLAETGVAHDRRFVDVSSAKSAMSDRVNALEVEAARRG